MNHILIMVCVVAALGPAVGRAADPADQELKRLEGVWASAPARKGRDRGHIIVFQGGRMLWRSFETRDGEPVIGHDELYEVRVDPKASPRQITGTRGDGDRKDVRRGIYELDGDTLKTAFGSGLDGERPKAFEGARPITLTRDKHARVPDLSKAGEPGQETAVEPTAKWFGQIADKTVAEQCPEKPITTAAEFEKVWKALRGGEAVPKVDFAKQFAVVHTLTNGKLTGIKLSIVEGEEEVDGAITAEASAGKKFEGLGYGIAVFRRDLVDVVDGRIVRKGAKK